MSLRFPHSLEVNSVFSVEDLIPYHALFDYPVAILDPLLQLFQDVSLFPFIHHKEKSLWGDDILDDDLYY